MTEVARVYSQSRRIFTFQKSRSGQMKMVKMDRTGVKTHRLKVDLFNKIAISTQVVSSLGS